MQCTLGVDIGTSSSKGVLVAADGTILARATRAHDVSRPRTGWVEMNADTWWTEFVELTRELLATVPEAVVISVGVSGMGPCVMLADHEDRPVRPAILYGVDTRASAQVARLTEELGETAIATVGGSVLSSQAGGPKLVWIAEEEPVAWARASRLYMPASWLVRKLTGEYCLDHHSASQVTPLYDLDAATWHESWWNRFAAPIEQPRLLWASEVAGGITAAAALETGLPTGIPVTAGTIDAWAEAVSVGAHEDGDLMLMYGTTMFLISTDAQTRRSPSMWTTVGAFPGTRNLAGGLATSGALTAWLSSITGVDFPQLLDEAARSGPGSRGLLTLPYFAGERTPIQDPDARGVVAGLTLEHTRGDLYRSALEATALAVRHNVATMRAAGSEISRVVAVGGGTQGRLWLQIVSDATGLTQELPSVTVGASYGSAFLAARAHAQLSDGEAGEHDLPRIADWNPPADVIEPNPDSSAVYDRLFALYTRLYEASKSVVHELADMQRETAPTDPARITRTETP